VRWLVWVAPKTRLWGELTKVGHIVACDAYCFWRNTILCFPNYHVQKHKALFELHDIGYACHRDYVSTLAKAPERFWWRRTRHGVNNA
jgi:hypothetical protein